MSTDLKIRALTARDLDDVLAIAGSCKEAPQWPRRLYEEILSADPAALVVRSALVAFFHGTLAGFAVANLSRVENQVELETIVVHPDFQRHRIGSGLLGHWMDSARRSGVSAMRLEVRESNAAALALYRAHGFSCVGRRRSYYTAPSEDALLLEAPLSPAGGPGLGPSSDVTGH